jgi:hypothetical protein
MARQRNNVARMPWEQRRIVGRMLFDGAGYAEIGAELRRQFPGAPRLHNSSLLAWQKGAEYRRYREAREKDREETEQTRAQAEALNDGRGPESYSDLIVMEVVRELWKKAQAGELSDLDNLKATTQAMAPLFRRREQELTADLQRMKLVHAAEIAELRKAHAAEAAEMRADNEALQAENEGLHAQLAAIEDTCRRAGIDTSGRAQGDLSAAARARIRKLYGLSETP